MTSSSADVGGSNDDIALSMRDDSKRATDPQHASSSVARTDVQGAKRLMIDSYSMSNVLANCS